MKTEGMKPATESTYQQLSSFKSIEELNAAIRYHRIKHDLSPTESQVFDVLAKYSAKYREGFLISGRTLSAI